jgi:acetyl esterase/lipase
MAALLGAPIALAAEPATQPAPLRILLWEKNVPNAATNPAPERDDGTGRIWNVSVPAMLVYLPPNDGHQHMAILHCPGGGYTHLTRLEGADGLVHEFGPDSVAIIALKYRLKPASSDVERDALADAQRAIRLIRHNANAWHIDPHRIGLVGASAGANLGLNTASRPSSTDPHATDPVDQESDRPDFICLLSPWPDQHPIATYPITKDVPPAFIASARDDKTAPTTFAEAIAAEYKTAGVPHELWQIDTGGHGAFGGPGEGAHWPEHFRNWLKQIGMNP